MRRSAVVSALLLVCGLVAPAQLPAPAAVDPSVDTVMTLWQERRLIEAQTEASRLVSVRPTDGTAWFWYGRTSHDAGALDEALRAYMRALELRPSYAEALNNIGDIYERREEWTRAKDYYRRAMALNPTLHAAYAGLGDVHRKNAEWREAVEAYRRAVELNALDHLSRERFEACERALLDLRRSGVVTASTLSDLATRSVGVGSDSRPSEPLRLAFGVQFRRNRYEVGDLTPVALRQLAEVVKVLASPEWKDRRLVLEGHACSCGPAAVNLALSRQRAGAILGYLASANVVAAVDVLVTPFGESKPSTDTGDENLNATVCERNDAHNANRRVVIRDWRGETNTPSPSGRVSFRYQPIGSTAFLPLRDGAVLHSGDAIQVSFQAFHSIYAYAFHRRAAGDWVVLFPNREFSREPEARNPLDPHRDYWVPAVRSGIPLDGSPGREEVLVYFSPGPDPELERMIRGRLDDGKVGSPPIEVIIGVRGATEAPADKSNSTHLPARWFARVRFEHQLPRP